MKKKLQILLLLGSLFSVPLLADGWDARLGIADFPNLNTLVGIEVTHITELTDTIELGYGGALRTDFSTAIGPGAIVRLRDWIFEPLAIGASTELGYMFAGNHSGLYYFVGPLLAIRPSPFLIEWEPGVIFFQGSSQFQALRFVVGFTL